MLLEYENIFWNLSLLFSSTISVYIVFAQQMCCLKLLNGVNILFF